MGDDDAVAEQVDPREGLFNCGDELARYGYDVMLLDFIDLYRHNDVHIVQKYGGIGRHYPVLLQIKHLAVYISQKKSSKTKMIFFILYLAREMR